MVGRFEAGKDTVQVLTEQAATHVGNITGIITGAVRDVARETGEWVTEVIEMREASERAVADHRADQDAGVEDADVEVDAEVVDVDPDDGADTAGR